MVIYKLLCGRAILQSIQPTIGSHTHKSTCYKLIRSYLGLPYPLFARHDTIQRVRVDVLSNSYALKITEPGKRESSSHDMQHIHRRQ